MPEQIDAYALITRSLDGRVETWNLGAGRILGFGTDEAVGMELQQLVRPARPDGAPGRDLRAAALERRHATVAGWLDRHQGEPFWGKHCFRSPATGTATPPGWYCCCVT